jgi:hypothetical protein
MVNLRSGVILLPMHDEAARTPSRNSTECVKDQFQSAIEQTAQVMKVKDADVAQWHDVTDTEDSPHKYVCIEWQEIGEQMDH